MSPQQLSAHYRIPGKLGEGDMGAVYRASETKLNRDVAVQDFPDWSSLIGPPERLAAS